MSSNVVSSGDVKSCNEDEKSEKEEGSGTTVGVSANSTNTGAKCDSPEAADTQQTSQTDQLTTQPNDSPEQTQPEAPRELVDFKVVYNKQKYDVSFALDDTVTSLKQHLEKLTGVPASMQKVMFKGKMRDDASLREHDVRKGCKMMLVGSTVTDVMSISAPDAKTLKEEEKKSIAASTEPLCKQKPHKTVLEKHGKPDDAMTGVKQKKERLPPHPLAGMYNKSGGKVRLTFKLEQDQLWIGTKERTDKIPMGSIKAVVSETIEGHEQYHLLAFQLGPTEASRYWVYWVPAQYVDSIKDAVLGKWQLY